MLLSYPGITVLVSAFPVLGSGMKPEGVLQDKMLLYLIYHSNPQLHLLGYSSPLSWGGMCPDGAEHGAVHTSLPRERESAEMCVKATLGKTPKM